MKQEIRTKAVVLAAGKSKRMKSRHSKIVHKILGKEIINFLLDSLVESGIHEEDIVVVCGDNIDQVRQAVKRNVRFAIQEQQLGTAHALLSAADFIKDFDGELLVTVGDNPYIIASEIQKLMAYHRKNSSACTFISAIFPHTPPPYGRVIRDAGGRVMNVVEEIDATPEELAIREVNSSIYIFDNKTVFPLLYKIDDNNAKKEYYLTDIIKILQDIDEPIFATPAEDYVISIGINNRWELQEAQARFNEQNLQRLALEEGVTILQPDTVTVELDVTVGQDTVIYPNTYIADGASIGGDCRIGPFAYLSGVSIADGETVAYEKREK
jgi:bifunctional UDP-N-acetylglucosamine pyrophosphorylase/glucosamine-1-phosphate N-acetyltransferase